MAAPTFTSITPALGARIPTNSYFTIKYTGTELDTIYEHYITFEDSDGEPISFSVSAVTYSGGINTFTVTPDEVLTKDTYYDITLLTSIEDISSDPIIERSFKFVTKKVDETATVEGNKVGQPVDTYYKKTLIPDLLDNQDIVLNGDKFNFSYIPSSYDIETRTYENAGDSYLVHDLLTYLKTKLNSQYFEGYDDYFSNIKAFEILTDSEFLNIEKALYSRPSDVAKSSGLVRKIKFLLELYATASGKHFVLVEPDPIEPFKYYITTDVPLTAWNGTIKPIVHPIGWQEKYVELGSYYVEYDAWAASTSYTVGDRIQVEGEEDTWWVVECTVAGTSGASAPQWITEIVTAGFTITDSGVTWTVIERLYQIHNLETEKYDWTEEEIDDFRDLLYIKGEGRALTVPYVTTTTNLDLSNTGNLYLRQVDGLIPARIVRETGSWTIDKIIQGCEIFIDGSISSNDGTYTVDSVIDQTDVGSDDCNVDSTSDWTETDSDIEVTFDNDHYEVKTDAANKYIYLENIEIVFGRTYKIDCQVKDGTTSSVEFQFYFDDGAEQLSTTKTTTSSWTTETSDISTKFEAISTTSSGKVGIKVLTDQNNKNFEIKNFACTEMSQIELVSTEDFTADETITISDSIGTDAFIGFDLNERDEGIWINGFLRPDPDPNEAVNDTTSDLYDSEAISPDYPSTTVGNWAHSEYEKYLDKPTWETSTSYSVGDLIIVNDYILRCTIAGTSGTTEPLWSFDYTSGETVTDSTVTWTLYDLYNTNSWQANKLYYVGNKILVENYIVECTVAGTSGTSEPTWSSTMNATVTDNTVTWKMLEVIETTRRDLLNVRNAIKTFPKFPLSYLEALTIIGISDVSAIVYDTFSRPDLAYKAVGSMTEQYDGDPFAVSGREEYAHVTQLKLVRGSAVTSFSNSGEDITFLYTSETRPVVFIESTTFTTAEFSFGNTDLANTSHETTNTTGSTFTIDNFVLPLGDYQDIVFDSGETVIALGAIETGDSLVITGATNGTNNGTFTVYRHDAFNRTITIVNSTGTVEGTTAATAQHTTPTFYDMETFLIPGTFSFDESLYYGFARIIAERQIDPSDWYSTDLFKYHYWSYDCEILYSDDTVPGVPDEPFKTEIESTDNFQVLTKDNLYSGTNIVFESHRYNVNSIVDGWFKNDLIYEYTDVGGGVPTSLIGTPFATVEADIDDVVILTSDDCSKNYITDWTVESANITLGYDSSNAYYEVTSNAVNQHVYIDNVELEQDHIYQIICEMSTDSSTSVDVNLSYYNGVTTSWVEGSTTNTLTSTMTEYTETFTYSSVDDSGCAVGLRVQTNMSGSDEIGLKNFIVYDTTDNLIVFSYLNGGTEFDDSTPNYYSKYSSIPEGIVLTSDVDYTISGTTSNLNPITTYDRKVEVLYNIPDFLDYVWLATPTSGTALQKTENNLFTFFVEQTAATCGVQVDVMHFLWRTDRTLLDTGQLTFDNRTNSLTRSAGDWTADTDPVLVDEYIYIKGATLNNGHFKIKTVTASTLTMTADTSFDDETISDLPENTEVNSKLILGWSPIYHNITPSTLTAL